MPGKPRRPGGAPRPGVGSSPVEDEDAVACLGYGRVEVRVRLAVRADAFQLELVQEEPVADLGLVRPQLLVQRPRDAERGLRAARLHHVRAVVPVQRLYEVAA